MNKNITRYHESEQFVVCDFEIVDLKPSEIDRELEKTRKTFKEKWIETLLVFKNNIKCDLIVSERNVGRKDVEFAKKNLVIMLKKQGYDWGVETIKGDGYI